MIRLGAFALVIVALLPPRSRAAGDCALPPNLSDRLRPGMVVFMADSPAILSKERCCGATVSFHIVERLWGSLPDGMVTVVLGYGFRESNDAQFLAVTPMPDGRYVDNGCGSVLSLPASHPWVRQFRNDLAARKPANLPVEVLSLHDYIPIPGSHVSLQSGDRILAGTTRGSLPLEMRAVPPGEYVATVSRSSFVSPGSPQRVSILPGSTVPLRLFLTPSSEVSGRVVDSRGEPLKNAEIHLRGHPRLTAPNHSLVEAAIQSVMGLIAAWIGSDRHGTERQTYLSTRTDDLGNFKFTAVFPGLHYLTTDMDEVNAAYHAPLPKIYYPGAYDWPTAMPLNIEEGQSKSGIVFQLPDFGPKRRVEIQVVSEDGVPVSKAIVSDAGLDPTNEHAAHAGPQKETDAQGRAAFDTWPVSVYRLRADFYLPRNRYSSDLADIPAGPAPVSRVLVLKGFRSAQ